MAAKKGAGLAAPQIGVPLQVVIFGVEHSERYPDAEPVPYTELVNPVLTPLSEAIDEDWEGCLSVPGLRGMVPRYAQLRYEGFDPLGHPIRREVTGFHARVVQHECNHRWASPIRCGCAIFQVRYTGHPSFRQRARTKPGTTRAPAPKSPGIVTF